MKSFTRVLFGLALAACLLFGLHQARATSQVQPAQQSQQAPAASENPQAPADASGNVAASAEKKPEAAEEKDETEPLRHSASVKLLAKLFGGNVEMAYWAAVFINFAIIAGFVIWAARKHLPGFFSNRTANIQKAMLEAQKAGEEARRKLAEIESRLMRLDGEIGQMRDSAEREAAAEEARIAAGTEEEVKKIAASAVQEIDAAAKAARRELAALTADLAVGLAAKQIHVDPATDQRLVDGFSRELDQVSSSSKGGR